MKRYGYKFKRLDGESSKAIDLRYFPILGGFIAIILVAMIFPPGNVIFAVCLLHIILGFVAEAFPRFAFVLILLATVITVGLTLYLFVPDIGSCYENCRTDKWFMLQGKIPRILTTPQFTLYLVVLLGYHAIYIWAAKSVINRG